MSELPIAPAGKSATVLPHLGHSEGMIIGGGCLGATGSHLKRHSAYAANKRDRESAVGQSVHDEQSE